MTSKALIRHLLNAQGVSQNKLADVLGIPRSAIWSRMRTGASDNMTVKTLSDMLGALGYKLQAVPETTALPPGGYSVGPAEEPQQ